MMAQHVPSLFVSTLHGRKIGPESSSNIQSNVAPDAQFDRLTEEIKHLSSTRYHGWVLPPVFAHGGGSAPSPLGNTPLTGKRINVDRKRSYSGLWRPSDALPENVFDCYPASYGLSDVNTSLSKFRQQPWCELLQLSFQNYDEQLSNGSIPEYTPITTDIEHGGLGAYDEEDKCIKQVHNVKESFFEEPGELNVIIPYSSNEGFEYSISVSSHAPVRSRLVGEDPVLNVFHLFQTELVFDASPDPLIADSQEVDTVEPELIKEELSNQSKSQEDDNEEDPCSIMTTGASTTSVRVLQLQTESQDESTNMKDDLMNVSGRYTFESKCISRSDENVSMDNNSEIDYEIFKVGDLSVAEAFENCMNFSSTVDTDSVTEDWLPLFDDTSAMAKHRLEWSGNNRFQWKQATLNYNDFKEGCKLYEIKERPEKCEMLTFDPPIKTPLKRPAQINLAFSKVNVNHIYSEDRKSVMKRLTKLPRRCQNRSQKSGETANVEKCVYREGFPNCSVPVKDRKVSTVTLSLGMEFEQRKCKIPVPVRCKRMLGKRECRNKGCLDKLSGSASGNSFFSCLNCCHRWNRYEKDTQYVFVGKSIFKDANEKSDDVRPLGVRYSEGTYEIANSEMKTNAAEASCNFHKHIERSCLSNYERSSDPQNETPEPTGVYLSPWLDLKEDVRTHENMSGTSLRECNAPVSNTATGSLSIGHESPDSATLQLTDNSASLHGGDSMRENEEVATGTPFWCASLQACSVVSLNDVPQNSPVDSARGNMSPVDNHCYINSVADSCGIRGTSLLKTSFRYSTEAGSPTCVNFQPAKLGSTRECSKLRQGVSDKLYPRPSGTASEDNLIERSIKPSSHRIEGIQEDSYDAAITQPRNYTPASFDSMFSDSVDSITSNKELHKSQHDSEIDEDNNQESCQYYVPSAYCCANKMLTDSLLPTHHNKTQHDGYSQSMRSFNTKEKYLHHENSIDLPCIYSNNTKKNLKTSESQEGTVYKNVRFSDVDKVISFKTDENSRHDEIPHAPVHQPIFKLKPIQQLNGECRITNTGLEQENRIPMLHKQTLQLRSQVSHLNVDNPVVRRLEFSNGVFRFCQNSTVHGKKHLKDVKWSAHSYRATKPCPDDMQVTGKRYQSQVKMSRPFKLGMSFAGSLSPNEKPVMYTICQNCEEELHVKFRNKCCPMNECMSSVNRQGTAKKDEQVVQEKEELGCCHNKGNACKSCDKIMTWSVARKTDKSTGVS